MISSCSKAKAFCISRPPLVIFIACMFVFGLTSLSLGLIIKGKAHLGDPDVLSWNRLLKLITKLDFCLIPPSSSSREKRNILSWSDANHGNNSEKSVNVSFSVPISASLVDSFYETFPKSGDDEIVSASGVVNMDQLDDRGDLNGPYLDQRIVLTFRLPKENENLPEICINVKGPENLLRDLNRGGSPNPANCSLSDVSSNVRFFSHSRNHLPMNWCEDGTKLDLSYELRPEWSILITDGDKRVVETHLMYTTVFLFAMAATLILVAFVKGAGNARDNSKYCSARGDMELLPSNDDQN